MDSNESISINAVLHEPPARARPLAFVVLGFLASAALCWLLWVLVPRQQHWVLLLAVPPVLGFAPLGLLLAARRATRHEAAACPGQLCTSAGVFTWEPVEGAALSWELEAVESVQVVHASAPEMLRHSSQTTKKGSRVFIVLTIASEKWSRVFETASVPYRVEKTLQRDGRDRVVVRLPIRPRIGSWMYGMSALPALWAIVTIILAILLGIVSYFFFAVLHIALSVIGPVFAALFLLAAAAVLVSVGRASMGLFIDERQVRIESMAHAATEKVTLTPLPRGGFVLRHSPEGQTDETPDADTAASPSSSPMLGEEMEVALYSVGSDQPEVIQSLLATARSRGKASEQ